jgi:hypothetical protein
MKKVLSIVLSIAMVVCLMPSMAFASADASGTGEVEGRQTFSDIDGLKCEGAVNVLNALGVVNGFPDGTFRPGEDVTRAHMAQMITKALDIETYANATTSIFSDMDSATWAIPQVEYCAQLGIVKGYGDGTFGPNDLVTYEQAATMLTRAVGYTDDCNEMIAGVWPANYVQKALDLGIFSDTDNGGTKNANRGDVAIMLYNALNLPQVYIDNDGVTQYRNGSEEFNRGGVNFWGTSMLFTLNKDGYYEYGVVTYDEIDDAVYDISDYFGIVAKIYRDKNDDVLALGDIQTSLITGSFNGDFDKFVSDGKEYTFGTSPVRGVEGERNARFEAISGAAARADVFDNGSLNGQLSNAMNDKGLDGLNMDNGFLIRSDEKVTLSAKVSGSSITQVFAVSHWSNKDNLNARTAIVEDSDIATINNKQTLLSYDFIKDNEGDPDTKTFTLVGVDELSDIAEDDVVTVYANDAKKIRRVEVGTEQVEGNLDSFSTGSAAETNKKWGKPGDVTIEGTTYKTSYLTIADSNDDGDLLQWTDQEDGEDVSVGDIVEAWLDYNGAVYCVKQSEAGTSSYAMVTDYYVSGYEDNAIDEKTTIINGAGLNGNNSMVSLMTSNGNVYTYYFKDGANLLRYNGKQDINEDGLRISVGDIVTYDLNAANRIRKLKLKGDNYMDAVDFIDDYDDVVPGSTVKMREGYFTKNDVTKKGYWGDWAISETATIFSVDKVTLRDPENSDVDAGRIPIFYIDDDDAGVTNYDSIKGTDDVLMGCRLIKNNKIASMVVNGDAVSSSKTFGYLSSWTKLSTDDPSGCTYRVTALINGESNTYYADIDDPVYNLRKVLVQFKFNASGNINEIRLPYNTSFITGGSYVTINEANSSWKDLRLLGYAVAGQEIEYNGESYNSLDSGVRFKNGATAAYIEYDLYNEGLTPAEWADSDYREGLISIESDARYYEWKGGSGAVANSTKGDIESADNGKYVLYFSIADDDDDASGVANVVLLLGKGTDGENAAEMNGCHLVGDIDLEALLSEVEDAELQAVIDPVDDADEGEAFLAVA